MSRDRHLSVGVDEREEIHQTAVCNSSAVGIVHAQFLEDSNRAEQVLCGAVVETHADGEHIPWGSSHNDRGRVQISKLCRSSSGTRDGSASSSMQYLKQNHAERQGCALGWCSRFEIWPRSQTGTLLLFYTESNNTLFSISRF